jgi:hypothetical protein
LWPQAARQVGELEGVTAQHVDVVADERGEAGDVLPVPLDAGQVDPAAGGVLEGARIGIRPAG